MSNYKRTVETIFAVISLTFFAKFLGFFRDALLGSKLGTNMETDAYLMALNSTSIIFVSIGSAIVTAAIPIIVERLTNKGRKEAFSFVNNLVNIFMVLSGMIVLGGILFSNSIMSIIASGFDEKKLALTVKLTQIMFPILICICITYLFVSLLQSLNRFKVTSMISFPANIIAILFLYFFSQEYGVTGLAVITLIGWIFQFLVQLPALYGEGYGYKMTLDFKDEDIKKFFSIFIPIIIVASVTQINMLLDQNQASFLENGKISFLYYANMLYLAIATTTVLGVSTVMFPKLAEKAVSMNKKQYVVYVTSILRLLIFILLPMTVGIVLLRNPIIRLVFERGAFGYGASINTGTALACYAIGMIGYGMQEVINRAFYAHKDVKSPVRFALFTISMNMILNMILVKEFDIGGLAISTAIASILGAIGLFIAFKRKMGYMETNRLFTTFFKTCIGCFIMATVVMISMKVLDGLFIQESLSQRMIKIIIPSVIGAITYAVTTILLKVEEAISIYEDFVKPVMNKMKG